MQRVLRSKVAANNLNKNQLSLTSMLRAFASSPQPNPYNSLRTNLGGSQFYKLPALNDSRYGKFNFYFN